MTNKHGQTRTTATISRLAQWRVKWLIEHSTSPQLLWCIDSFVVNQTLFFQIKFSSKSPALRIVAKR